MINLHNNKIWFCPRAFCHIYANTRGTYKVCCLAENSPHNVEDTSIEEWFNSDYLNDIRKHMLTENVDMSKLSDCQRCINQEKIQGTSERISFLNGLTPAERNKIEKAISNFTKTKNYPIQDRILDIKLKMFGNKCNLDCYMCYPHSSTTRQIAMKKITTHIKEFSDDDTKQTSKETMNSLIQQVKDLKQYIDSITIIGGEPLLMNEHYSLLNELIESDDAKNISLYYQTNLTVLRHNNHDLLDCIKHFKHARFGISIDGVHEYNDYMRKNSKFGVIHNNIRFMKMCDNVDVSLSSVVSMLSLLRWRRLVEYANKEKLPIHEMILYDPDCLHIRHLPDKIKTRLKILYKKNPRIFNELNRDRDETQFQIAMKYCIERDKIYGTDVFELFPELKDYVDENIING